MMWHVPQKAGVEESCAETTTNTMPRPRARAAPKVARRIPRGAMRPPLTRASQRPAPESGPGPGRPAMSGAPRAPSLEAEQDKDGEQEVEPEQDQDVAPHLEVAELVLE